jgi:hypothetical protein
MFAQVILRKSWKGPPETQHVLQTQDLGGTVASLFIKSAKGAALATK